MTTNYRNVFIEVAPDCPAAEPESPPRHGDRPTVAALQYRMLLERPHELTSDELIFAVYAERAGILESETDAEREGFFAKDQPCLRSSPLGKRYGWGTHHDEDGRVALYGVGTPEYEQLRSDPSLQHKTAMRSSRR